MKDVLRLFLLSAVLVLSACGGAKSQTTGENKPKEPELAAPTGLEVLAVDDDEMIPFWDDRSDLPEDVETCYEISSTDFDHPMYLFGFFPSNCYTVRNGATKIRIHSFDPLSDKSVGKTYYLRVRHHRINTNVYSGWSNVYCVTLPPP